VTVPPTSQTKFTLLSKAATLEFERTTFLSVSLLWTVLLCATFPSPSWKIFCGAGRPLWFFQREISFRENPPLPTSERDTRHYPPWLNEHTAGLYGFFLFSQRSPLDQYCRSTLGCSAAPGLLLAADAPIGFQGFYATLAWSATDVKMFFLFRACLLATFLVFCFEEPGGPDFDRRVLRVEDFFRFLFVALSLTLDPSICLGRLMWTFQTRGLGDYWNLILFSFLVRRSHGMICLL